MRSHLHRVVVVAHHWAPHVGGIETVARQQARGLAERGVDVEVHTTRLPRRAARTSLESSTDARGRLRVIRHRAVEPLLRFAQLPVPLPGPGMVRRVIGAARSADVVVAHGHTFPTTALAALAARLAGRPFVLVQHAPWIVYGPVLDGVQRIVDRAVGRRVIGAASAVVCVSEHTARYVRSIVLTAPVSVVPNGVDPERSFSGPDSGIRMEDRTTRPVVLFVGRLVERNGWRVLVEAWRRSGLGGRAELHLVGCGPDEGALREATQDLPGVVLLGAVADDVLIDRYRSAHVVVVPTLTGVGFGLTAAEALARGTPVIASDEGGLREVVRHEVDGLLVAPGDPDTLAAAIARVVEDEDLHALLSAAARQVDRSSETALEALHTILVGTLTRVRGARGCV